ncbi:uncharacterized protein LOC118467854 isoform X2 [Anopheles albimanus]|nr:uncharacterized protein LOC118467854 isoform X2 [Anopheles albimanus]
MRIRFQKDAQCMREHVRSCSLLRRPVLIVFFRHREGNISAYVIEVQLLCPETTDSSRPTVPIQGGGYNSFNLVRHGVAGVSQSDRRADVRNAGLQHIQEMMPMIG